MKRTMLNGLATMYTELAKACTGYTDDARRVIPYDHALVMGRLHKFIRIQRHAEAVYGNITLSLMGRQS